MAGVRRAGIAIARAGRGGLGAHLLPLSGGEPGLQAGWQSWDQHSALWTPHSALLPSPPFVKSRTPDIRYTWYEGEGVRQGGCCELNGRCLPKPSPVHCPKQSKRLAFVTPGQLVRGLCPGEQPTRPRSYQLIQRLCRNFLLCDLGLANSHNRAEAVLPPLRRNVCS